MDAGLPGGGWQDQVGGLMPGIKVGRSRAQLPLKVEVEEITVPEGFVQTLNDHLLLVYTGKTRLARNLLQVSPSPAGKVALGRAGPGPHCTPPAPSAGCTEELVCPAACRCAECPQPAAAHQHVCGGFPPR